MAGMLPGVEAARRRRIHNNYSGSQVSQSRRPSFCLYATTHESLSKSSMREFPMGQKGLFDESMGVAAREAKKRLDERLHLQTQSRSQTNRFSKGVQSSRSIDNMTIMQSDSQPQLQVPKLTKNKSKRLKWLKIGWKSCEQEECSICLDEFKSGKGESVIMQLGCGHKFHSKCLMPWLDSNAQCPCCRKPNPF